MGELSIRGFAWLELWVGNARQSARFFETALGFSAVAYAGPRTGVPDRSSYLLEQAGLRIIVSGGVAPRSTISEFVSVHGEGVRDIALDVDDVNHCYERAIDNGAIGLGEPRSRPAGEGLMQTATVAAFGDCTISFVRTNGSPLPLLPGFEPLEALDRSGPKVGLTQLDHLAVGVREGTRLSWARRFESLLGAGPIAGADQHIDIGTSAFDMSTVRAANGSVIFVFAEPAPGPEQSQIADFLEYYGGDGVHHVAFATADIVRSVAALREQGLHTLPVPATYYEDARTRLGDVDLPWPELERWGILVDKDADGYLLQAFTEALGDRPTIYLELIQREGSRAFGTANVRALYHAVVLEQQAHRNPV